MVAGLSELWTDEFASWLAGCWIEQVMIHGIYLETECRYPGLDVWGKSRASLGTSKKCSVSPRASSSLIWGRHMGGRPEADRRHWSIRRGETDGLCDGRAGPGYEPPVERDLARSYAVSRSRKPIDGMHGHVASFPHHFLSGSFGNPQHARGKRCNRHSWKEYTRGPSDRNETHMRLHSFINRLLLYKISKQPCNRPLGCSAS